MNWVQLVSNIVASSGLVSIGFAALEQFTGHGGWQHYVGAAAMGAASNLVGLFQPPPHASDAPPGVGGH